MVAWIRTNLSLYQSILILSSLNPSCVSWREIVNFDPSRLTLDFCCAAAVPDGDGNGGDVRNRAGSSPAASVPPVVGGQLGSLGAPSIVSFAVDDPNNGDTVYGDGDVITMGHSHIEVRIIWPNQQ